jgi:hypothetical protein
MESSAGQLQVAPTKGRELQDRGRIVSRTHSELQKLLSGYQGSRDLDDEADAQRPADNDDEPLKK